MKKILLVASATLLVGCESTPKYNPRTSEQIAAERQAAQAEEEARRETMSAEFEKERVEAGQQRERYVKEHPALPEEHKRAIRELTLTVGLPLEVVQVIFGGLLRHSESDGIGGKWSMWESVNGSRFYLFFENDRLVRWDKR